MKFGVRLPNLGPLAGQDAIRKVALKAEELNYDFLTVNDHIAWPNEYKYHLSSGSAELVDKMERANDYYESVATLSYVAGLTERIRLIVTCIVPALRNPIVLAKQLMTLQSLSRGRFILGIGIGNVRPEFEQMGIPWKKRASMTNEYLEVLKAFFSSQDKSVSYKGTYVQFNGIEMFPRTKIPMWLGGKFVRPTMERVAKFGDGFIPSGNPQDFTDGLSKLDVILAEHGRKRTELELAAEPMVCIAKTDEEARSISAKTIGLYAGGALEKGGVVGAPDTCAMKIGGYREAGVQVMELRIISRGLDHMLEEMEIFATKIAPKFT
jgi:alkanesulfonate monooxygenase SsuD/methylene tetrahydromethanopterin reductase-like flavin-dependent oxidoreductase (luciferase family)